MERQVSRIKPLVSIILPTFNGERYIRQAIDSILAQSYDNWELIVQDNASTDRTASIVKEFKDNRIKYDVNPKNVGMAANFNLGIRRAKGEYLSLFSDDDRMLPDYLEKQIAHLEANPQIGFSFCTHYVINEEGKRLYRPSHAWDDQYRRTPCVASPAIGLFLLLNYGCLPGTISTVVIRANCLDRVGLFKEHYVMSLDWDMWIRLTACFGFGFLNERLVEVRMHPGQGQHERGRLYGRINEAFQCLNRLKEELLPYCGNEQPYWETRMRRGITRKYGQAFFHSIMRAFLSMDFKNAFSCWRLLRKEQGLLPPIIQWLAYLPARIKRRVSGRGKREMQTIFRNDEMDLYFKKYKTKGGAH